MARSSYDVMDLKALRCFWAMAKYGSLTRAGVELGISEAAVSQRIRALARHLRVKLYEVRGGRIRLTPAGERTYALGIGIFREIGDFEQVVTQDEATGSLTLAASETILRFVLPDVVQRFVGRFPLVRLRLLNRNVMEIVKGVQMNEFDLGLITQRKVSEGLAFHPIRTYKSYVLLQHGHPLTRKGIPALGDLLKEDILRRYPLVAAEPDDPDDRRLEDTLQRLGLPYNPALEVGTHETMKYYVMRGLGVAVISGICLEDLDGKLFDLIEVPSEYGGDTTYGVVMRRDKHVTGPLSGLFDLVGLRIDSPDGKHIVKKRTVL